MANRLGERRAVYYGQPWPRQPIPIRCGGWQSDTLTLERHGYKFLVERNIEYMAYRIVIGKSGCQTAIMVEDLNFERLMDARIPLEFHGEFVDKIPVDDIKKPRAQFRRVSMNDAYWCEMEVMRDMRHVDPRELFPQSETAADSLIVLPDKQTVKDALEIILEKQAPRMEEIKQNRKRRNLVEQTQATIVTLEEIA
jgi:hypothetical protein